MSSKNRKVYLMGRKSIREFFSAPTRFLAQSISKESEFEKPYLDDDRAQMHLDLPVADWPPFPPLPPWPPLPEVEGPVPKLSWCGITCDEPLDCDEPIWCHPWVWCGTDLQCNLCSWVVTGDAIGYAPHPMYGGTKGIDIWIDTTLADEGGNVFIHAQMKDPCENLCGADIELTCRVCPPDVVVSWDTDLSPTTIPISSTRQVYVKDGLGPYTWEVIGTGFSMLHITTSGVVNTLISNGSACGSATITVTDFCKGTTKGIVRGPGQWVIQDYANASSNPNPTKCNGPVSGGANCTGNVEIIDGEERWYIYNQSCYGHKLGLGDPCTGLDVISWAELHAYLDNWKEPPCGAPIPCASQTCTSDIKCGGYWCVTCLMHGNAYYYKWGC